MEFRQIVAYHGPNRWSGVPTLEVLVDLGALRTWRSSADPSVITRLLSWLPVLDDPPQQAPSQSGDVPLQASFHKLAEHGLPLVDLLRRVTCVLEAAAGTPPEYSRCEVTDDGTICRLTFQFEEESLGRACLETARQCVQAALSDTAFDAPAEIRKLVDLADDVRLGPSTRAILRAAAARGLPCRRLTDGSLVQLGEGAKQHRIWTAETDETGSIGEDIAQDKELTKKLLRQVGVPVPQGRVAQTADEACRIAREIGFPVVLKPRDANHGRGISFDLMTCEGITEAFDHALGENSTGTTGVIVEQFARGAAHRLLVVGDRLIAAIRGQSDVVVGNGRSTIAELIDEANRDPRRGENYTDKLDTMALNEAAKLRLKRQGLTPDSILSQGQEIIVCYNGDLTTDETSEVHPAVAERAVLAAQTVGLNIAGMDVIAEDISRPLEEQGGVIIEVNAGPSLSIHVEPLYGQPQPVGDAIVELMFPGGEDGRIPIVGIAGGAEASQIGRLIAGLLRKLGRRVGLAMGCEISVDDQRPYVLRGSDQDRIRSLLLHPRVEAAIFESQTEEALAIGLGCERCDVVVLANLASANAETLIDGVLPLVYAVPLEGAAIIPATAPHIDQLLSACRGHTLLYSTAGETARLRDHQARGGRVAFFLHDSLILGSGPNAFFMPLKGIESSGPIVREHLLPAVAVAWSAGVPVELLRDILARTGL
ncbi:cyanophycin synthetase [Planctomycetia bacterium]|nr:cyanophycin synthetase [Planctomycetia bacterium]